MDWGDVVVEVRVFGVFDFGGERASFGEGAFCGLELRFRFCLELRFRLSDIWAGTGAGILECVFRDVDGFEALGDEGFFGSGVE